MLSHISTHSIASALRLSLQNMHREIITAQQETVSGQMADPGLALGAGNGKRISLLGDAQRLSSILETNKLASSRLTITQDAIGQAKTQIEAMMSSLTAAIGGDNNPSVVANSARTALQDVTAVLNTTHGGDYVFAGINTDARPITDYAGSAMQVAVDAAFTSYFGFTKNDPAAQAITAASMKTFIDNQIEPLFLGAGWSSMSTASDDGIRSRITKTQSVETSVSANEMGFRKATYAAVIAAEFFSGNLGGAARSAVAEKSLGLVGNAAADLGDLQSRVGFLQQQVGDATDRIRLQSERLTSLGDDLSAVDPYQAATKLNMLLTQIETSYQITKRVQNLSLMNYL